MVRKFRSVKSIFIVLFLVMLLCGNSVLAGPQDAAECKKRATEKYPYLAIETCTRQIESNPDDLDSVFWRGFAYFKRGLSSKNDYQSALADFTRVLETYPDDMQALENRASCYLELERYKEAITDASEVIASDSKALGAFMVRAKAYYWLNRYEESVSDYTSALALNPRSEDTKFEAYWGRAQSQKYQKKYEDALADYRIARVIKPWQGQNISGLMAECFAKMGRKSEAINAWKEKIAIIDNDPAKRNDSYYMKEKANAKAEIEKLSK